MSALIEIVISQPEILFRDYEINSISSTIKNGFYYEFGSSFILVSEGGKYIGLIGREGITRAITEIDKSFNLPVRDYSINCTGGLELILIRIHNSIANDFGMQERLNIKMQLELEDLYQLLKNLIIKVNRDLVIFLRNIENLDLQELDELLGGITQYGVHVVCTCNLQSLLNTPNLLHNVDVILPVKPAKKTQLIKIYYEKKRILGLKLPENYIEFIIDHQYRRGIYHRAFGIDILL